ncbi:hypothetical protein CCR80_11620 [Rhodothalassium salexigens]|uniref:SAM hydrolase/SAM-dependent halogenase family protein n=1 Tax=Rhodothalassium salexigens TaxID=1086 RepID=UPI001914B908|nr:SAM-dependent chlorinase/fluorinase [Rhodothalassium salexigens]MBK5921679.1 hypothetical protein [Rhodothalassium salexigens]
MLLLFTDFGYDGPYVGEMTAAALIAAPDVVPVQLMHDAPAFDPCAAAYLLAALTERMAPDAVVCGVVDPGVGSARPAVVLEADGRRFVGPDNGLFEIVARRARSVRWRRLAEAPARLSASFHGRDLFAPAAARLASGQPVALEPAPGDARPGRDWPDDADRVVYVDRYGNAMTGRRAATLPGHAQAVLGARRLTRARTFADMSPGQGFWYENSAGLAEIAVNQGSASLAFDLGVGSPVHWVR